jgi:hypothetical protein
MKKYTAVIWWIGLNYLEKLDKWGSYRAISTTCYSSVENLSFDQIEEIYNMK